MYGFTESYPIIVDTIGKLYTKTQIVRSQANTWYSDIYFVREQTTNTNIFEIFQDSRQNW